MLRTPVLLSAARPRLVRARPKVGSYLRLIDSCITQLKAQGPSRTCNESKEEEEKRRKVFYWVGGDNTPTVWGVLGSGFTKRHGLWFTVYAVCFIITVWRFGSRVHGLG